MGTHADRGRTFARTVAVLAVLAPLLVLVPALGNRASAQGSGEDGYAAAPPRATSGSPYRVRLEVDLPVLALGMAGSLMHFVDVPPAACLPRCDASRINALDRPLAGTYSGAALTWANVAVAAAVALPPLLGLIDAGGDGWLEDAVVFAETLFVTQTLVQLSKLAIERPAPLVYGSDAPRSALEGRDAARSFFSGHTATAFAATTAFSTTFWLRHPRSPWRWVVVGLGVALASGAALLKVAAGYHYWSDVGAGALVGSALGVLVPVLHR